MTSWMLTDPWTLYFPTRKADPRRRMADREIPKALFLDMLNALNGKLADLNERITFLCVGGGAMMLAYDAREATHDLDGVISPASEEARDLLFDLAREVAADFSAKGKPVASDWINTQVHAIMRAQTYSRSDFEGRPGMRWSHLTLLFAKPEMLLAMKCQSLRPGRRDFSDAATLIRRCGIKTIEQLQRVIAPYIDWGFLDNEDTGNLKVAIAWAFPGQTEYEPIRQRMLDRYRKIKGR
jgi:hypothetical protein